MSSVRFFSDWILVTDEGAFEILRHPDPVARMAHLLRWLVQRAICRSRGHRADPCRTCGRSRNLPRRAGALSFAIVDGGALYTVRTELEGEEEAPWEM